MTPREVQLKLERLRDEAKTIELRTHAATMLFQTAVLQANGPLADGQRALLHELYDQALDNIAMSLSLLRMAQKGPE